MADSTDSRVQLVCQLQCSELFYDSLQIPKSFWECLCMLEQCIPAVSFDPHGLGTYVYCTPCICLHGTYGFVCIKLTLWLTCIHTTHQAIEFAMEEGDEELWEVLISMSIHSPSEGISFARLPYTPLHCELRLCDTRML